MRLFVSADLHDLAESIKTVQQQFEDASGLRFTDPAQAHITLTFLGDTDQERIPELTRELEAAVADSGVDPFTLEVSGLGVFPSLDYIRVLWVGVTQGSEQLTALHEEIEQRTTALGFDPEDHEFTPHATIARMDHAGGKDVIQNTVQSENPTVGRITLDEIRLKKSELTENGPRYSTVERFEL